MKIGTARIGSAVPASRRAAAANGGGGKAAELCPPPGARRLFRVTPSPTNINFEVSQRPGTFQRYSAVSNCNCVLCRAVPRRAPQRIAARSLRAFSAKYFCGRGSVIEAVAVALFSWASLRALALVLPLTPADALCSLPTTVGTLCRVPGVPGAAAGPIGRGHCSRLLPLSRRAPQGRLLVLPWSTAAACSLT